MSYSLGICLQLTKWEALGRRGVAQWAGSRSAMCLMNIRTLTTHATRRSLRVSPPCAVSLALRQGNPPRPLSLSFISLLSLSLSPDAFAALMAKTINSQRTHTHTDSHTHTAPHTRTAWRRLPSWCILASALLISFWSLFCKWLSAFKMRQNELAAIPSTATAVPHPAPHSPPFPGSLTLILRRGRFSLIICAAQKISRKTKTTTRTGGGGATAATDANNKKEPRWK